MGELTEDEKVFLEEAYEQLKKIRIRKIRL
jgi:hypothetical protein